MNYRIDCEVVRVMDNFLSTNLFKPVVVICYAHIQSTEKLYKWIQQKPHTRYFELNDNEARPVNGLVRDSPSECLF